MKNDQAGGQAFPIYNTCSGMTLRDYFAAKSLPVSMAMLAHDWDAHLGKKWAWNSIEVEMLVENAYALADAMLKERAK